MVFWVLLAYTVSRVLSFMTFASSGVIRMRIRIYERLLMDRFNVYLATKNMSMEERHYDERNTIVQYSWEETGASAEYGGAPPRVTVEYDRATGFMLAVVIDYNRRKAKKAAALTGAEVRNRVADDIVNAGVFENRTYTFREEIQIASEEEVAELVADEKAA
jgi:hypothetical protein